MAAMVWEANPGGCVDTCSYGGPSEREFEDPWQRGGDAGAGLMHLVGVAAELLAEAHGHRVLQMRAADFDDFVKLARLAVEFALEFIHGRKEALVQSFGGGDVHGGGKYVVARLASIDLVVGMGASQVADDFVGIHVGGGAAAGLENVHHELIVIAAFGHFEGGMLNFREAIDTRGAGLDQSQGADEGSLQAHPADGKILHGKGGLRSVKCGIGSGVVSGIGHAHVLL